MTAVDKTADRVRAIVAFEAALRDAEAEARFWRDEVATARTRLDEARTQLLGEMEADGVLQHRVAGLVITVAPTPRGVVITDEAALPDAMVRVIRTPDKRAIKAALDRGDIVPGASLDNGGSTLRIAAAARSEG